MAVCKHIMIRHFKVPSARFNLPVSRATMGLSLWVMGLMFLSGCSFFASSPPRLKVELRYDDRPIPCGTTLGVGSGGWYLEHSKFYLNDFRDQQGRTLPLQNSKWQTGNLALISIEQKDCWRGGEIPGNHQIRFADSVDLSQVNTLSFTLGVPNDLASAPPLTQPSPLNLSSMFWTMDAGHKFARIELNKVSQTWAFHLGGVDCAQADGSAPCYQARQLEFALPRPDSGATTLVFHIDRLLQGVELNEAGSCTFQPGQAQSCTRLLENLHQSVIEWI